MFWHLCSFHLTFFICFFSHSLFNCSVCFVRGPDCIILCRCFCPSTILKELIFPTTIFGYIHVCISHWSLTRWTVVKWHVMDDEWGLFYSVDSAYGLGMVITCMRMTLRHFPSSIAWTSTTYLFALVKFWATILTKKNQT